MVRWLLNHLDNLPLFDKAAGDLQTPFNKAPFSRGLISSHLLLRLTPGPSLSSTLQPSVFLRCPVSPLSLLLSPPFALPSLFVPGIKRVSLTLRALSPGRRIHAHAASRPHAASPLQFRSGSRVSWCFSWRILEEVVVKGQADLLWTKVERKRTFDRLKQEDKK